MNYLAIDTSGFHLTVIAKGDKGEHTYYNENCSLKHSVMLMSAIEETLERASLKKEEIDVFCCALGPGSFTGIRIGVATIKAFAYALNKKVLGVTSLDILAYNRIAENVFALIDAKHGHVYCAGYSGGKIAVEPAYRPIDELCEFSRDYVFISSSMIDGAQTESVSLAEGFRAAVEANLDRATFDVESVIPMYIRKSQAEEGR